MRTLCSVLGIFGMAGTYSLLYVYAMELFPTVVRSAALGSSRQLGHTGAILVPFVVVMDAGLTFMVFAVCGIVGGILMFFSARNIKHLLR
ncbi:putative major facilitator superfamily domain, MFS transporter superfamily [Helianthus anomalus]